LSDSADESGKADMLIGVEAGSSSSSHLKAIFIH